MEIEGGSMMIRFSGSGNVYKLQRPNIYGAIVAEPVDDGEQLLLKPEMVQRMLETGVIEEVSDGD